MNDAARGARDGAMMSGVTLRVARASTSAMLASLLRDELLSGALAPGAPLRDTELAARANVSRGTAREALAELAREGLVVQTLHRGVRVASPTERDVADVYAARRVLETAGLDVLLRTGELAALEDALHGLERARSVPEGVEADAAFHLAIVAATGVERLVAAAERALREVRLVLCAADRATADLDVQVAGHRELLAAIASGDGEAAREALLAHLAHGEERARAVVAGRP
jgi:DNA-binding GntR family transcriptional regulator